MKILVVFLISSFILFSQDKSPIETLSLDEALTIGIKNNRNIITANLEVQKAYKEKWNTIATGLPQIKASVDYQNFIEQPISLIPAEFFGGNKGDFAEVSFGTKQSINAGLKLDQLIFDGSYLVGLQAIKVFLEESKNFREKTIIEVKKSIVSTYSSVLLTRENIKFLKKNKLSLESNLIKTTELFRSGFDEEESVEQIRLTLSEVNSQLRYSENIERITLGMLKLLLGYSSEDLLLLSNTLEEIINDGLFQIKNENTKTSDISKNIDVRIAENNVDSKKLLYRLEQSKYLPSISAFINGFYTGNNDEFTFSDQRQKWFGSSVFGLSIKLPIFSSLARSAKTQKAKLSFEQAKINLEETKEKIDLELKAAYNEYGLSLENYFTYQENLSLAENIENKNQLKYFEGIITGFELGQIQLQLYNSQNNYLKSIQNIIVKKINLESLINN